MKTYSVTDVFGVKKEMVLSYIERERVDGKFVNALQEDKHIIIYGASKQGKSALIQKHVDLEDLIPVNCSPQMTTRDIYNSLLRQIGVEIESSRETTTESNGELGFKTIFKAFLPFVASADAEVSGKMSEKEGSKTVIKPIEFNLELAQDVSEILKKCRFNKWVIIENFHYLKEDIQKSFAFDLRIFQDTGFKFIILGIWKEKNRILQFNRDLIDRVQEIPVEPWRNNDFDLVIQKGSEKLNIKFSDEIIKKINECAFGNIGIVQELCKQTCIIAGVDQTQKNKYLIEDNGFIQEAIDIKLEEYSASHIKSLECIASSSIQAGGLFMPYYLVKIIIMEDVDSLRTGIQRTDMPELFRKFHYRPNDVRSGDITYLINNLAELQLKNKISPPLFDYDVLGRKLRIIDSTLMFFLKFKNREEILEDIFDPTESLINQ